MPMRSTIPPSGSCLGDLDLIEILRLGVVDRAPEECAQVADVGRDRCGPQRRELPLRRVVELGSEAAVDQCLVGDGSRLDTGDTCGRSWVIGRLVGVAVVRCSGASVLRCFGRRRSPRPFTPYSAVPAQSRSTSSPARRRPVRAPRLAPPSRACGAEGDLQQRERIDVRIAQPDRRLEHRRVAQQVLRVRGSRSTASTVRWNSSSSCASSAMSPPSCVHVGARDLEVGLGAHHLDLAEQVVEERPARRHASQPLDALRRARRLARARCRRRASR